MSISVGASGVVLVTFKSHRTLPPYRIENQCNNVVFSVAQAAMLHQSHSDIVFNRLDPGDSTAFAWDEPNARHTLHLCAQLQVRAIT